MKVAQSSLFGSLHRIRHGFFYPGKDRPLEKNFSFKNGAVEHVLSARQSACGLIGARHDHLTHVYQEHGVTILDITSEHRGCGAATGEGQVGVADAMISSEKDVPLAILIADCLPVFFTDKSERAVGIAHAGWRGSLDAISQKMVERFTQDYGIPPHELQIWIGPGISHRHFEIGHEVWEQFQARWNDCGECFHQRDTYYLDLKSLNHYQLARSGVLPENIEVSEECTYANPEMFSYRRDGAGKGHNLAVIELRSA